MFGPSFQTMVPNPTFNPVMKPGMHAQAAQGARRGRWTRGTSTPTRARRGGQKSRCPAALSDMDAVFAMDEQGVEKAWMFPTLAVGVEGLIPEMVEHDLQALSLVQPMAGGGLGMELQGPHHFRRRHPGA